MKILTWQNPGQLFVAQELINKVKSKCCGIKDGMKIGLSRLYEFCDRNNIPRRCYRKKVE